MRHAVKKIVAICSLVLSKLGRSCGVKLLQVLLEFPWLWSAGSTAVSQWQGLKSPSSFLKVPRQLEEQFVFLVFILVPLHRSGRSQTKPCSDGELLWLNRAALWVSGGFLWGGEGFCGCLGGRGLWTCWQSLSPSWFAMQIGSWALRRARLGWCS